MQLADGAATSSKIGAGAVDTVKMAAGAATDVISLQATGVPVTGNRGSNLNGGTWTDVVSYNYTSPVDAIVEVTVTGSVTVQTPASGAAGMDDWGYVRVVLHLGGETIPTPRTRIIEDELGWSKTITRAFAFSQEVTVSGGVPVTLSFYMQGQAGGQVTTADVTNMRLTGVKR